MHPNSFGARFLVVLYGIYQAGHIIFNSLNFPKQSASLPFPPPPDGWSPQTLQFLTGMAASDLLNAVLTLVFVYGYFTKAKWRMWLGTLTLTVSIYAAVVFTYGTIASGAWAGNLFGYLWLYVPFIPAVILFVLVGVWALQGRFLDSGTKAKGDVT